MVTIKNTFAMVTAMLIGGTAAIAQDAANIPQAYPQFQPAGLIRAQMTQGSVFTFPAPRGWNVGETIAGIQLTSPDNTMSFGFCGVEGLNCPDPLTFVRMMTTVPGCSNWQVLDAKATMNQGGTQIVEAIISYQGNGVTMRVWARSAMVRAYGTCNCYMLSACTEASIFDHVIGDLKSLAEQIQVGNGGAAFQRDVRLQNIQNRNLNHPMDHSFADGYWQGQKTQDDAMRRSSDVRRDSYTSYDPHTGQGYYHNGGAYDANGGVVNPERPNEYLNPAPHWQGH